MFVYKITDIDTGLVYIGVDTKPKRLERRWRHHIRTASKSDHPPTKLYKAMHGRAERFMYEVMFESSNVGELFLKEIELIALHDSYHNGYNSTEGGDCFNVAVASSEEYKELVEIFRHRQVSANRARWGDTTPEERKSLTSHLHTNDVYERKSKSLKSYWDEVGNTAKLEQLEGLLTFIENNKDFYRKTAKAASDVARLKNIKSITLQDLSTGEIWSFPSQREAKITLGIDVNYIMKKHRHGKPDKKWKVIDEGI